MDHLPRHLSPGVEPLGIPLIAKIVYDLEDFTDYPDRHGFIKDDETELDLSGDSTDLAAFLQSWLWFVVVAEFFGRPVKFDEFARRSTLTRGSKNYSRYVLDSTVLRPLLQNVVQKGVGAQAFAGSNSTLIRLRYVSDRASSCAEWFDLHLEDGRSPVPEVLF
ncbi:hypothetical protein K432DRAFT_393544 [Lepidopterella palustris CBS 459.81]|uniref:Uncharacterized protein n=1 Tax=Lepidopterella palustris CBS 459.81 TaxID=1314670 RepID=A0A8E2E9N6_9PEZI|nr:hypothetical protein K432DRAFT_393544 [Lepidopterella palustris CBS 459.81]